MFFVSFLSKKRICSLCLSVLKEKYALYVFLSKKKKYVLYVFLSKKEEHVLYVFLSKHIELVFLLYNI